MHTQAMTSSLDISAVGNVIFTQFKVREPNKTLIAMLADDLRDGTAQQGTSLRDYIAQLSSERRHHEVNIRLGTCTCADRGARGIICKHMFAIFATTGLTFRDLPLSLSGAPYLVIDDDVVRAMAELPAEDEEDAELDTACEVPYKSVIDEDVVRAMTELQGEHEEDAELDTACELPNKATALAMYHISVGYRGSGCSLVVAL
eukprot:gene22443-29557_t